MLVEAQAAAFLAIGGVVEYVEDCQKARPPAWAK